MVGSALPYWRLSGFYFFYFATLGILVPYWGLYLQWEGFTARQIGELTAILLAARIIAPNLWGWLADRQDKRMPIVRLASFLTVLVFSGVLVEQSFVWMALILMGFSFFWNASLPQIEVVTLQHLGSYTAHYSKIRLWGSIGFIIVVLSLGGLLERFNADIVPYALLLTLSGIWVVSMTLPEARKTTAQSTNITFLKLIRQPAMLAFFSICFLMLVSHGPYYTFYSIYLESYGYSRTLIGLLWSLGVLAEVGIFLLMHRWLPYFGMRQILFISCLLSAFRWILIALFPQHLSLLLIAQSLHAASYGMFHAAAIAWVHAFFTGKNQGRGQALYSSVSFGAGGAIGSLLSGYLWIYPGANQTFLLAAIVAMLASLVAFFGLRQAKSIASNPNSMPF